MKRLGGVKPHARVPSEADRYLLTHLPTNAEATERWCEQEAAARLRRGDPVVYICKARMKEPSGVLGWRWFCLDQDTLDLLGGRVGGSSQIVRTLTPQVEHGTETRQKRSGKRTRKRRGS